MRMLRSSSIGRAWIAWMGVRERLSGGGGSVRTESARRICTWSPGGRLSIVYIAARLRSSVSRVRSSPTSSASPRSSVRARLGGASFVGSGGGSGVGVGGSISATGSGASATRAASEGVLTFRNGSGPKNSSRAPPDSHTNSPTIPTKVPRMTCASADRPSPWCTRRSGGASRPANDELSPSSPT